MKHAESATKPKGRPPEVLREISKGTQWKKGQSGNPAGRFPDKAISEGLRAFYYENPIEFKRFLSAAHKRSTGKNPSAKFWELIADRIEGKVSQQVEVHGNILHVVSDVDRKNALSAIEAIRAFESDSQTPLIAEEVDEKS